MFFKTAIIIPFSLFGCSCLCAQQVESWTSVKGQVLEAKGVSWTTDGINIERASDQKKLLIPSINDKKKVFTDTITETNIQNEVRKVKVENF